MYKNNEFIGIDVSKDTFDVWNTEFGHLCFSNNAKRFLIQSLKRQIKNLQKEIKYLEAKVESLIKENESDMLTNISSISGIGKKTAIMLIASTYAFKFFEDYKQLLSFFGLCPIEFSSGSSIRGRSRISKKGNPLVRHYLFLCSFGLSV